MKKIIILLACICMVFSLAACSTSSASSNNNASTTTTSSGIAEDQIGGIVEKWMKNYMSENERFVYDISTLNDEGTYWDVWGNGTVYNAYGNPHDNRNFHINIDKATGEVTRID